MDVYGESLYSAVSDFVNCRLLDLGDTISRTFALIRESPIRSVLNVYYSLGRFARILVPAYGI